MTKREKRLQKIRQNPRNVAFGELQQVLEDYGFYMKAGTGTSHNVFIALIKDKDWTLVIPFKQPHVKETYVKKALKAIDEIIELIEDEEEKEDNE